MDDLVLNPNRIDAKLESQMAEWQDAINDYQALEDICREEIEDELLPIIEDLRERPAHYKDRKYSANVQALAGKLIRANELQKRLESSRRDDDSSSLGSRIKYYLCFACSNNSTTRKSAMESTIRETVSMSNNLSISDKLSEKWAFRLNEINPTQGSSSVNAKSLQNTGLVKSDAPMDIKFKPKWPDFLIDTYFDVIKINMYGRKMRRIIKLTQHYVVNITNGSEISKFYAYREIRRVWLESGDTIVVVLKNGKQSVYMSHIAPHVLQQVCALDALVTVVVVVSCIKSCSFTTTIPVFLTYDSNYCSLLLIFVDHHACTSEKVAGQGRIPRAGVQSRLQRRRHRWHYQEHFRREHP